VRVIIPATGVESERGEYDRVSKRHLLKLTPDLTSRWATGNDNFVCSSLWDFKRSFTCRKNEHRFFIVLNTCKKQHHNRLHPIIRLWQDNVYRVSGFYSVTKLKKISISLCLHSILNISQPKHGLSFILVTLYMTVVLLDCLIRCVSPGGRF
jgi:hypothetical protein